MEFEEVTDLETIDVEEVLQTVSPGDVYPPEIPNEYALSTLTIEGSEENLAALNDILEQLTQMNELMQSTYDEEHITIVEKEMDSITFKEFILVTILCIVLADFIIKHIGGIFRCLK